MRNVIEEARMVLPGIQALFGFQTIAVFNQRFMDLPRPMQVCHLLALALVVLAIALAMAPAAYHRIVESHQVSEQTVRLSSGFICAALAPLAGGLALDMAVVLYLVTPSYAASAAGTAGTLALLLGLWFALPLRARKQRGEAPAHRSRLPGH
ncbi:hypothetical protein H3H39_24055 [Duganella sp. LX47W]|uniref:Uncharacterized protein n=2 Tax=Rugamonas apoptosis TaxID=2758570 RepID=A0A7W2FEC3_9BURK|nr:hypothetical protein [Rugamonas apoptosis]